jgi:hypothetical protein
MADNEIKLVLNTDPSQLEAGLVQAINNLKKFEAALKKATDVKEIEYLQKSIGALQDKIKQLKPIPNPVTPEFTNNTNKASYALTNLSRVASDAPFGFIAIQNNLDPLLSSFGQLQKETGSVGGALKALGSSLAGPAGIAVGFSVVSALVTTAIQKYGSLGAAVDALFNSLDATAQAQQNITNEFVKSDASVKSQLESLNVLVKVYDDVNTTEEGRKNIMQKIRSEYAKYLPDLDKEKITISDIKDNYAILSQTLIELGRVKALNKLIDDQSLVTEKLRAAKAEESVGIFDQLKNTFLSFGNTSLAAFKNSTTGVINQFEAIKESEKITASYRAELFKVEQALANKRLVSTKDTEETKQKTKVTKEQARVTADYWKELATLNKEQENAFSKGTTSLFGKGGNGVLKNIEALQAAGKQVNDTFVKVGETITGILAPAFQSAFDSILSGSQSAFQAFGQAIAGIIKKLIAAAATAALLAVIIAAATGGGNVGFAATFGTQFKGIFGQLAGFKFADGGIVTGPTRALIGEAGPEAVIPLSKLDNIVGGNQNIFVTGVLSGENIYLQQQRTSARRSRFV